MPRTIVRCSLTPCKMKFSQRINLSTRRNKHQDCRTWTILPLKSHDPNKFRLILRTLIARLFHAHPSCPVSARMSEDLWKEWIIRINWKEPAFHLTHLNPLFLSISWACGASSFCAKLKIVSRSCNARKHDFQFVIDWTIWVYLPLSDLRLSQKLFHRWDNVTKNDNSHWTHEMPSIFSRDFYWIFCTPLCVFWWIFTQIFVEMKYF